MRTALYGLTFSWEPLETCVWPIGNAVRVHAGSRATRRSVNKQDGLEYCSHPCNKRRCSKLQRQPYVGERYYRREAPC